METSEVITECSRKSVLVGPRALYSTIHKIHSQSFCCLCNYSCSVLQDRQALKKIYRTVCHVLSLAFMALYEGRHSLSHIRLGFGNIYLVVNTRKNSN